MKPRVALSFFLFCLTGPLGCSEALYPPRPSQVPGPPIADPPQSRVVMHVTLSRAGLSQLVEAAVPLTDKGTFSFLGQRTYFWRRTPFELSFDSATGKIGARCQVTGQADLPATTMHFPLTITAEAQPVLSADYTAQLQAPVVTITTEDRLMKAAEWSGGVLQTIRGAVEKQLKDLRIDLRPLLAPAYATLARPLPIHIGDANACVDLGIQTFEAGPTVLAGGVEKDLAVVLAPSVTLPCTPNGGAPLTDKALPPLHNVASIPSGPFEVVVPVAATYDEMRKAMVQAFTNGKLYFSPEFPELYLEKPEVYASGGEIVVKLHLSGFVKKGFRVHLEGDLYMNGHPQVRDNELEVPDLQPTVETKDALLALKTRLDGEGMRRQVRQALRVDIGSRLRAVRARLSSELTFAQPARPGNPAGPAVPRACLRADVGKIEVSGIYAHDSYMRLYVKVTAQAAAYLPCPFKLVD